MVDFLSGRAGNAHHFLRDPVSLERFDRAAGRPLGALSADIAFMIEPEPLAADETLGAFVAGERDAGRPVVGVNIHPMLSSSRDETEIAALVDSAVRTCNWLHAERGASIALIPHDYRLAPNGDGDMLERVRSGCDPDVRVALPAAPLSAAQIKGLVAALDLVVSGRMHLAIAAFGAGTPVLGITYQGKFDGLFAGHFGCPPRARDLGIAGGRSGRAARARGGDARGAAAAARENRRARRGGAGAVAAQHRAPAARGGGGRSRLMGRAVWVTELPPATGRGGQERYNADVAAAMRALGHELHLIVTGPRADLLPAPADIDAPGVASIDFVHFANVAGRLRPRTPAAAARSLKRALTGMRPAGTATGAAKVAHIGRALSDREARKIGDAGRGAGPGRGARGHRVPLAPPPGWSGSGARAPC